MNVKEIDKYNKKLRDELFKNLNDIIDDLVWFVNWIKILGEKFFKRLYLMIE